MAGIVSMAGSSGLTENPINNFYMEIDQDWPYRQQWEERLNFAGMSGALNVTFMDNEAGITESVGVNYADTAILGRAESYKQYIGTNNREVSLTLQFRAQGKPTTVGGVNPTIADWLRAEVQNPVRWLDSLRYPFVERLGASRVAHAPPPLVLYIGELLRMRCLLTDAQITWMHPVDPVTLLPYGADVACTFTAVTIDPGNYGFVGPDRWGSEGDRFRLSSPLASNAV